MNTIDRLDPVCWVPIARKPASQAWLWRAWLGHWLRRLAAPTFQPPQDDLAELTELDARTLADIGAPDRLIARAMARREVQHQEREGVRIGLASGAWHHW